MICRCGKEIEGNPRKIYCSIRCKRSAGNKQYRLSNPEKVRERSRDKHLIAKYGIDFEEKLALLKKQGDVCALCKRSNPSHSNGWSVDHDHNTGEIRGILCHKCNTLLGNLGDTEEKIKVFYLKIMEYLCPHSPRD